MSIAESDQYTKKFTQFGDMIRKAHKAVFIIVIPILSIIILLFVMSLFKDKNNGHNGIVDIGNGDGSVIEVMRTPNGGTIIQCGNELVNVSEDGKISYSKPGYSYNGQEK